MDTLVIVIVVLVVLLVWVFAMYNGLVRGRIRVEEAWADIDVQLKRRYDLIPNLVETVKGYAAHESETLTAVMEARSQATAITVDASGVDMGAMAALAGAEAGLGGMLGKLMAVAEAYPDLKADKNFLELQGSLEDTENKIQAARRFYNGIVRDYNTTVEVIPTNIIAGMFRFVKKEFFELPEASIAREPVPVSYTHLTLPTILRV